MGVNIGFFPGLAKPGKWYVAREVLVGMHAGLGIKFRYTTAPHKLDKDARHDDFHGHVEYFSDKVGWATVMALPLSISVAYVFR